ncbi:MAG: hypothetical protein ABIG84_04140, partial [archaeon]
DEYRTMYTNTTAEDINSNKKTASFAKNITAAVNFLRAYKEIWHPDPGAPNNLSVRIRIQSIGDPLTEILLADYLPEGANIVSRNITYYNKTNDETNQLYNDSDYYLGPPTQDTLTDGTPAEVYHYNFSYKFTNWDGSLYNNDTITIEYNVTVLGGGEWVLPAILGGYDPSYQKHIKTEMYTDVSVPQFDIILSMLTDQVNAGETVVALLKILNVGGPRAKVDVMITYSAKDMKGTLITESTDTIAVVEKKEETLSLKIPQHVSPGQYNFETFVTYTGKEAMSTRPFEVKGEEPKESIDIYFGKYGLYGILLFIILLLLFRRTR